MSWTNLTAWVLVLSATVGGQEPRPEDRLRPDPVLREGLRALLAARDEAGFRSALATLEAAAGDEHERLVTQLFEFSRQATDTREAMLFGVVTDQLRIPAEHVVRALVPLLELPDAGLRRDLDGTLSEFEDRSAERGASFTIYRPYLEQEPPPGLVRHLFEADPDAALLALMRAQPLEPGELRRLLWAQHEVADGLWKLRFGFLAPEDLARELPEMSRQLGILARHARWWARLYAARVVFEVPLLAAAADLNALSQDANPLVREFARAAREGR